MKCLLWTDGFTPRMGGIEVQGLHFLRGMQASGHQFHIIANQDQIDWPQSECIENTPIERFQFNALIEKKTLSELKRIDQALNTILTQFKPDVIHLYTCTGGAAIVYLLMRARFLTIPTILTVHGIFTPDFKIDPLIDRVLKAVDHISCVSQAVLMQLRIYAPLAAQKAGVIHNGLPLPDLIPSSLSFAPPTLACIARLSPEKGIDVILHALALVKEAIPTIRLLIAGDGPERAALLDLTAFLQLQNHVSFLGPLAPDQIPEVINQSCMILMPSRMEAFGLTALQSLQMGRPVIASRIGGLPEIIEHEQSGLLVAMDNIDELAQAILRLAQHPEQTQTLGLQGRKRAITQFSLQNHVERYEALYQHAVKSKDATYAAVS